MPVMNSVYCPDNAVEWIRWHISEELEDALNEIERCIELAYLIEIAYKSIPWSGATSDIFKGFFSIISGIINLNI